MSEEILDIWGQEKENANSHQKHLFLMQRHVPYDMVYPLMKGSEIISSLKKMTVSIYDIYRLSYTDTFVFMLNNMSRYLKLYFVVCTKKNEWQWKNPCAIV